MPVYEKDLFISYAHIDNQPLIADKSGWISRFHASLEALLSMRLGKSARIWRDDKLQGNDKFADEIVTQFDSTAALVSVLTPRYLKSTWCAREASEFCKRADQAGGMVIKRKARVFKVVKSPVETEDALPPLMKELLGYEFYKFEDGVPVEMDDAFGKQYGQDFNRMVNKLAFEIAQLLKDIDEETDVESVPDTDTDTADNCINAKQSLNIYLAECGYDLKTYRESLETELHRMGYNVYPDRQLPRNEADYVDTVDKLLQQCQLSIHLVGENYGVVPDGPSEKSVIELQNELASGYSQTQQLPRIIWLPDGSKATHAQQRAFIKSLQENADAQRGADLINGTFEHARSAIDVAITALENKRDADNSSDIETESTDDQATVHLICTRDDRKATVPIRKFLRDKSYTVTTPAFEGDAAEVRSINQHLLTNADLVLVFYGTGDEAWKRSIDTELRKMQGYSNKTQSKPTFTYLAPEPSEDKEDMVEMEEPNLINGLDGFCEQDMQAWLQSTHEQAVSA